MRKPMKQTILFTIIIFATVTSTAQIPVLDEYIAEGIKTTWHYSKRNSRSKRASRR